jgi:hypothetical protein
MVSEAQRTLVKSPPELWAELSDPTSLARHLREFGEIRITSSKPEKAIDWEGESITGTIKLAASGWGTKVTLTATREAALPETPPEPEPIPESEPIAAIEPLAEVLPEPEIEPATESRRGFFARLFRRRYKLQDSAAPEPEQTVELEQLVEPEPEPTPEPEQAQPDLAAELAAAEELITDQTTAVLTAVLDRLGAAHHRPFSRA